MDYCIVDYGASVSDELQTPAIQRAIDACHLAGGGRVVIPRGVFRTGGFRLRSHVTLYLESGAVLEGSRNPEDYTDYVHDTVEPLDVQNGHGMHVSVYPYSRWNNAIIRSHNARDIAVIGEPGACIDGCNSYDPQGEEDFRGPHGMSFHNCEGITLRGYTIRNTGNWAHNICVSKNITVDDVTVYGGHDGLDIRTCDGVSVENCSFFTGDDCIAGFDNYGVTIRNCYLNTACNALRMGGTDVLIDSCIAVSPSAFGHRRDLRPEAKRQGAPTDSACNHDMRAFFRYYCDERAVPRYTPGNIRIQNCNASCPGAVFQMFFDPGQVWCNTRALSSITFENCVFRGIRLTSRIVGDENEPIRFLMKDCVMETLTGCEDLPVFLAGSFHRICLENVRIDSFQHPRIVLKQGRHTGTVEYKGTPVLQLVQEDS